MCLSLLRLSLVLIEAVVAVNVSGKVHMAALKAYSEPTSISSLFWERKPVSHPLFASVIMLASNEVEESSEFTIHYWLLCSGESQMLFLVMRYLTTTLKR